MDADRTALTDAKSARVEPMLPGKAIDPATANNRQFLEVVPRRFRTGSPGRDLPKRVSDWNKVFEQFRRWAVSGDFERVFGNLCPIQTLRIGCFASRNAGPGPCPSFICTSGRGPAIAAVEGPLMNESDAGRRSQDLSVQFLTRDAPRADELVVAPGTAMPNRSNHRVGNRIQDMEDLRNYVDNPTSV